MTWVLIFILYAGPPLDHAVDRYEEEHLTRLSCEQALQGLAIAGDSVMRAWCEERREDLGGVRSQRKRQLVEDPQHPTQSRPSRRVARPARLRPTSHAPSLPLTEVTP